MSRFDMPVVAEPQRAQLPALQRTTLANGVRVWTAAHRALPVAAVAAIIDGGSAHDPADRPGLLGLTVDMLDEGAGGRGSIALAEAFADFGATCDTQVGPDAASASLWTMTKYLPEAFALMADVLLRPHLEAVDLTRVRELRLSRLQQLRRSASAAAERVFSQQVFGAHGYAHSALGTTASISAITIDDVRACFAQAIGGGPLTIVAVGDVEHDRIVALVDAQFGAGRRGAAPILDARVSLTDAPVTQFVERPGSAQSEVRVGHLGPGRLTPVFHPLMVLNAGLGGSFSGRLNLRLRQQLGYTYGARSAFDFDRVAGTFSCEASVQADKTAESVQEIAQIVRDVCGERPLTVDELELARATLTRGYARYFETPRQVAGAFAQLCLYGLPDDTFDAYVPLMQAVSAADVTAAAQECLHPDRFVTVVVGDSEARRGLERAGIGVERVTAEF